MKRSAGANYITSATIGHDSIVPQCTYTRKLHPRNLSIIDRALIAVLIIDVLATAYSCGGLLAVLLAVRP